MAILSAIYSYDGNIIIPNSLSTWSFIIEILLSNLAFHSEVLLIDPFLLELKMVDLFFFSYFFYLFLDLGLKLKISMISYVTVTYYHTLVTYHIEGHRRF